jgi:hypothetical protein
MTAVVPTDFQFNLREEIERIFMASFPSVPLRGVSL